MMPTSFARQLSTLLLISTSLSACAKPAANSKDLDALLPPEPSLPSQVCTELKAQQTAIKGVLPDAVDHDPANSSPDSARLQAAIDACPAGAAVKLVSDGAHNAFLSGPFHIKSGVTLWIDKGVTLMASRSPADYDLGDGICGSAQAKLKNRCQNWINAKDTINSGIVGQGTLDGRGGAVMTSGAYAYKATWWDLSMQSKAKPKLEQNNPRLLHIDGGKNFTLYQITFSNSPKFHIGSNDVDRLTAWDMKLITPSLAFSVPGYKCAPGTFPEPGKLDKPSSCFMPEVVKNTDGFDPGTSTHVTLAYSWISTGDDNVAIKSGGKKGGPFTRHHLYAHNHFYYGHGMSIGSETDAGVNDIKVWDLVTDGMDSGHGVGIRIKSDGKRGGEVSEVLYQDVCMRRVKEPLIFSPYYDKTDRTDMAPNFHDITLRNFHYVDYPKAKYNKGTITFSGYAEGGKLNPLGIALDNLVFDQLQKIKQPNHNINYSFGPGKVVNFPEQKADSIKIVDKQSGKSEAYGCPDSAFKKFPSDMSPI